MIQRRERLLIECDLESERDLNWEVNAVVHTLEQGTPALVGGHWWKNINNTSWLEIPPPGVVLDSGRLFVQTSSQTIANTTTETSLFDGGVGTRDFNPFILILGSRVVVQLRGFGSRASGNVTVRVKLNGTVIGTTGAVLAGTLANDLWSIDFNFTCRSVGASGTVIGQGWFWNINSNDPRQMVNTATTTINTTIQQTLEVTWQWSVANAGNTVTCTNAFVNI